MYFSEDVSYRMSFDLVSSNYHQARPGYPVEMYNDMAQIMGFDSDAPKLKIGSILEVGSGSGQATESLSVLASAVDCIEPGENFVQIMNSKFEGSPHVAIHQTTYEEFIPDKKYDLIFSGCAFHWISKDVVFGKSREILKDGGWLMAVWNMPRFDDEIYLLIKELIIPFQEEFDIPRGSKDQLEYFNEGFSEFSEKRGFINCMKNVYEGKRVLNNESLTNLIWSYIDLRELAEYDIKSIYRNLLSGVYELGKSRHIVHNYYPFAAGQKASIQSGGAK